MMLSFRIGGAIQVLALCGVWSACQPQRLCAEDWPALPDRDATVTLPAQPWPHKPGPRTITALIHYPGGKVENVGPNTGLMLTLHNWGGSDCVGTADPRQLAQRLNVVAICVNYLQSGNKASLQDPEPYDHGYLQALDALRALWFVHHGLKLQSRPFAAGRIFCTGGSGGGNVTLMANKLAPRTFACAIDMCGMKKLRHAVAYGWPGGAGLNARWSREPGHPNYLSADEQEIRFVGHPRHLAVMRDLKNTCKVIVVHGTTDLPSYDDAVELVGNMRGAELDVEPWFIKPEHVDGKVFTTTGHALGNRTSIVFQVAGKYAVPDGPSALVRRGPGDFDLRDELVRYPTSNGTYIISYRDGYPVGRFEPEPPPVHYDEHQELTYYRDRQGSRHPVRTPADWEVRRQHILANLQLVTGKLPGVTSRVPLDLKTVEETQIGKLRRRKVTYQSDADDRVAAWLFLPDMTAPGGAEASAAAPRRLPAILCLQQTTGKGKDEPAGLAGDPSLHYALHLAERGYIALAPDYPSFGEHAYDFAPQHGYVSGSMKAVWDNVRALDLLTQMPEVDAARIGCIGHSLGGHNSILTATFDPRIKVIVSSCGFCRFHKDDIPSWTGPRYMPRIASVYGNSADKLPFDFTELVGSFAPRPFLACAAKKDSDFDVTGVEDVIKAAKPVYKLFGNEDHLQAYYPEGGHSFPADARDVAYRFLDKHLQNDLANANGK